MKSLKTIRKKHAGRSNNGQVTVRHQGGEHKRFLRAIDFRRNKIGVIGKIATLEYDPNRTTDIALVHYADGDKQYILAPAGLQINDSIVSGNDVDVKVGNTLPLAVIPLGTIVHNIELTRGKGGQMARSAGTGAIVTAREENYVHLKLPSGEIRKVLGDGFATVGQLGNIDWKNRVFKKAGTKRHMGIRPTVRGVAMNPRSHPHGGGEGRSGIGMNTPKNYAGNSAVGRRRRPNKYSDKYIVQRRKK